MQTSSRSNESVIDTGNHGILHEVARQACEPSSSQQCKVMGSRWTQEQWWQAFHFLFLDPRSPSQHSGLGSAPTAKQGQREGAAKAAASSLLHECDDMLHFVYDAAKPSGPQIQVRRRAGQVVAALPPELHIGGAHYARVAWKDTLLLNLVLQAVYFLTIVVCRQDALPLVSQGRLHHPSLRTVRKRVYASPMHAAVSLAAAERAAPRAAQSYPDICFSVLDFHDAFDDVVLEQADDCYCVLLQLAHGPAVVAAERSSRAQAHPTPFSESHSSTMVSPAMHPGATPTSSAHATTFLHDAFHAQHDAAFSDPQLALDSHAQSSTSTNPGAQHGDKHSTIANPAAGHTTLFAAYVSHATVQAHMASKACTPGSTASGWPRGSQRDGRLQGPSLLSKLLAATGLSKAGSGLEQKGHSRPMGQHIQQHQQQRKDGSSRSFGPQEVIMIGPNQVGCASVAATEVACSGASVPQHLQSHSDWESKGQHAGTAAAADGNVGNGGRGSDSNDGSCNRAGDRFDDGGGDVSGSGGCGVCEAGDWSHVRLGLRCALMSLSLPQAALLTQLLAPWANGA